MAKKPKKGGRNAQPAKRRTTRTPAPRGAQASPSRRPTSRASVPRVEAPVSAADVQGLLTQLQYLREEIDEIREVIASAAEPVNLAWIEEPEELELDVAPTPPKRRRLPPTSRAR